MRLCICMSIGRVMSVHTAAPTSSTEREYSSREAELVDTSGQLPPEFAFRHDPRAGNAPGALDIYMISNSSDLGNQKSEIEGGKSTDSPLTVSATLFLDQSISISPFGFLTKFLMVPKALESESEDAVSTTCTPSQNCDSLPRTTCAQPYAQPHHRPRRH